MKNKMLLFLVFTSLLLSQVKVYALTGDAMVEFESKDKVKVGETFNVKLNVSSNESGIVSLEGNLVFDENMIEYVSTNKLETPYEFHINENYNYKLAGLDLTLENGILNNTAVYEFTFKAINEGKTEITLKNYKLTDRSDYVSTIVVGKNIVIEKENSELIQENENHEELKVEEVEIHGEKETINSNLLMENSNTYGTENNDDSAIIKQGNEPKELVKENNSFIIELDRITKIILDKIMIIFK